MRPRITTALAVAAATFALACAPPTSPLELAGTYNLLTVNGSPLPFVLAQDQSTKVEALDDRYILTSSATYTSVGHKRYTVGTVVSITVPVDAGTFTRRGDSVTLESPLAGVRSGTIIRGTFTLVQGAFTLVYVK